MPNPDVQESLDELLDSAGLNALGATVRADLLRYIDLLVKWNRVWNLTAVRDPLQMVPRHILDSLTLLPYLDARLGHVPDSADVDLLDIGSGAGLPVLPLAIARRQLRCLSVERTEKKARFQRQIVLELGLEHVQVQAERIETVTAKAQVVTSRAFMNPADFLELAAGHVVGGGFAIVMLGRAERMPQTPPEGWSLECLEPVPVLSGDPQRHIAVCKARSL